MDERASSRTQDKRQCTTRRAGKRSAVRVALLGLAAGGLLTACGGSSPTANQASAAQRSQQPQQTSAARSNPDRINEQLSTYDDALLRCFDQHDAGIQTDTEVNKNTAAGQLPIHAVDEDEMGRLNQESPTSLQQSTTYVQTSKRSGPMWDVDLYPSPAAAQARIAPVTAKVRALAIRQGSSYEAHVWQVGQSLVITTAAVPGGKSPGWLAACVQTAETAIGASTTTRSQGPSASGGPRSPTRHRSISLVADPSSAAPGTRIHLAVKMHTLSPNDDVIVWLDHNDPTCKRSPDAVQNAPTGEVQYFNDASDGVQTLINSLSGTWSGDETLSVDLNSGPATVCAAMYDDGTHSRVAPVAKQTFTVTG